MDAGSEIIAAHPWHVEIDNMEKLLLWLRMPWTGERGPVNGTELHWSESPVDNKEDGGMGTERGQFKRRQLIEADC